MDCRKRRPVQDATAPSEDSFTLPSGRALDLPLPRCQTVFGRHLGKPALPPALQPAIRTVLPAGMVVMISESVPGRMRRLTLAVVAAVLVLGTGSCPAEGGYCCARPGPVIAAAAMMLSVALSALKRKGMGSLSSPTTAPSWSTARKWRVNPSA